MIGLKDNAEINITGNAATATKLKTARTISLTGDVTGSGSFDGNSNVSINCSVEGGSGDNIPTGAILEYSGDDIPEGYEETSDGMNIISSNSTVSNIISLTNAEFTAMQTAGTLVNGTIYNIIDD